MNAQPLNLVLTAILGLFILGFLCLMYSPDLLERWALEMRARARGLRASQEAYRTAFRQSYADDARSEKEREEARRMFLALSDPERERIPE